MISEMNQFDFSLNMFSVPADAALCKLAHALPDIKGTAPQNTFEMLQMTKDEFDAQSRLP